MLEFRSLTSRIWEIHAEDAVAFARHLSNSNIDVVEVASDEIMVIGPDDGGRTTIESSDRGVSVDATDAWACWSLFGDQAHAAFSMLSEVPLPSPGSSMCCDVAHVPTRVVVHGERRVDIFVASPHEAYLRERILEDCASLKPREVEPA